MIRSQEVVRKVLSFFNIGEEDWNTQADARRRYVRYPGVHAEVGVGQHKYSISDWSLGGISFETGPDASLAIGDKLTLSLTFRFPHDIITVKHAAKVVRTARRGTAAEFLPLAGEARRQLERVLDSVYTQSFLESQAS